MSLRRTYLPLKQLPFNAPTAAGAVALVLASIALGALVVEYGAWVGSNFVRAVAFPAALVLLFMLVLDKSRLFMLIILIRAPVDPLLEATRFAPFLGLGALLNALIILIALLFVFERPQPAVRTVLPMWGPLILVFVFVLFRSPEPVPAFRIFLNYVSYVAVFLIPFYLKEFRKDMRWCVYLVILSSLIPALYGIVEFAQGSVAGRAMSTFPHPNIFAFYIVLVVAVSLYAIKSPLMNTSWQGRVLLAAYIGLLLVLLVLTKTRSAYAAAVVVFLVYGLVFERRYLLYIATGCWLAMLVPDVRDRVLEAYYGPASMSSMYELNSYEWRKFLWECAWDWMKWQDMPLGYGLLSFPYYSLQFFPMNNGIKWGAHSVYVEWFFEAGILGVLCAAWLFRKLFSLLRRGLRQDRLGTVILITIVLAYLVFSYADNMLGYLGFNWYFWFVLGTACAILVDRDAAATGPDPTRKIAPA